MKTELELPADLLRDATAAASRQGVAVDSVVTEAVRQWLEANAETIANAPVVPDWPVPPPDVPKEELRKLRQDIEEAFPILR